ncbi:MAG: hypothetical protein WBP40_03800 [Candidatus Moraniibacteriota bacterium]
MNWFKTQKSTVSAAAPDSLSALVRTMEDDLAGREVPTEMKKHAEPLVAFRPEAVMGVPFFTAPGVATEEKPSHQTAEESPFLQEAPATDQISDDEAPTFDPPLIVPKSPVVPETPSISPVHPETTSVAFSTTHRSVVAPSVRESLASLLRLTQGFAPLFRDRKLRLVALLAGSLLVVVVIAGAYLWWRSSLEDDPNQPDVRVESPAVQTNQLKSEPVSQAKYLVEQPNILTFDIETVTSEQIKNGLLQAAQTIKKDNLPGAIEFLIRDQKLNPLAFSRFAYLAKLNLPAELLGTLDEPFSLYVTIDNGRPRLALLVYVKDEPAFAAKLLLNESKLAQAIEPLFLDVTTAPKNNLIFRDGTYLERPVRFTNVDASLGLSVDYAVRGRQWIIGTSKDSLRAVLDKTGL